MHASATPTDRSGRHRDAWRQLLLSCIGSLYFDRIDRIQVGSNPASKTPFPGIPTLYVCLHRNGAADGWVLQQAIQRPLQFLISSQLTRSFLGRVFFSGIEIARSDAEGDRSQNAVAFDACLDCLHAGGDLVVFPEGTSSLGPRHLPFRSGAFHIIHRALKAGIRFHVIPVGLHYECAPHFRRCVEVVTGPAISFAESDALPGIREIRRRTTAALEEVGFNVSSRTRLERAERVARIRYRTGGGCLFTLLKGLEAGLPESTSTALSLLPRHRASRWFRVDGVPHFSANPIAVDLPLTTLLGALWLAGVLAQLPVVLTAGFAAGRMADGSNVVCLWRILVGMPACLLWNGLILVASLACERPWLAALAAGLGWTAAKVHRPFLLGMSALATRRLKTSEQQAIRHLAGFPASATHEPFRRCA